MRILRALAVLTVLAVAVVGTGGIAACTDKPSGGTGPIAVTATDTECRLATTEIAAGTARFTVTNKGSEATGFYVYGPGDQVMGELANVPPGLARGLTVELSAGIYQTACKRPAMTAMTGMTGRGLRGLLKVTGAAAPLATHAKLAAVTAGYQRYVHSQGSALIDKTGEFVAAIKAGDAARAKALYPVARTYWERIEPVTETFGDLSLAVDGREGDVAPGSEFTGYHRLEKDLWDTKDIARSGPTADRLMADLRKIVERADSKKLTPLLLANSAKELLDEVATKKITGEEEHYSHTDLWDFAADVEGSKAAIAALRPVLDEWTPDLVKTLDEKFAAVEAALGRHRKGDRWRLHNELSQTELKALSGAINALGEPVSTVAAVVAPRS